MSLPSSHPDASDGTTLLSATPVLASLDILRSVAFFCEQLGFTSLYAEQGAYGVVMRDAVSIHFWACKEAHIAQNTSCRVQVSGIAALYRHCQALAIVHPNGALADRPWGAREFAILDPDHNLVTFSERLPAPH